jgi:hypothetical protein
LHAIKRFANWNLAVLSEELPSTGQLAAPPAKKAHFDRAVRSMIRLWTGEVIFMRLCIISTALKVHGG